MAGFDGVLLTDLYQLTMLEAYRAEGLAEEAVFEFFVRKLPPERNFLMAAGLDQALDYLETLRFSEADLEWLRADGRFDPAFVDSLRHFRFTGEVHAVPEGAVVFPEEPLLRVTARLPEAQLVESRLINILHFQTLVASKAARSRLAAPAKRLLDFGMRRAHGGEAAVMAARASYLAGFDGSATVAAARLWGVPLVGTMAHSYVQAHASETEAFEAFARARPQGVVLLIDTYDTEQAARDLVRLAPGLASAGVRIEGVRIDSGDLITLSRRVRAILDDGGLRGVAIMVSGGLDEHDVALCEGGGAPIDGYGVGTSLTTSADAPSLDCAYKLQEYAGIARRKRSPGKATWPGRKQVWREVGGDGRLLQDRVALEGETQPGRPLLEPVMQGGRRLPGPTLAQSRALAEEALAALPEPLRGLGRAAPYTVTVSEGIRALAAEVDARTGPSR